MAYQTRCGNFNNRLHYYCFYWYNRPDFTVTIQTRHLRTSWSKWSATAY